MRSRTVLAASVVSAFLTAGAQAADLPRRAAAPVMAPVPVVAAYDWTGWYLGLHVGGGWVVADFSDLTGSSALDDRSITSNGWLGGGQVGFNWQSGSWVFGGELQGSLANLSGSRRSVFRNLTVHNEVDSIVTLAARSGYAYQNWLWYGKVGGAWADADAHWVNVNNGNTVARQSDTLSGWMVGLGVEYAWSPNMSAKLEYNYMDFGEDSASRLSCGSGCRFSENIDRRTHVVMLGWNYRFPVR
jgi:outer membrane immunogenic protein